jgi:lipase maturation factor 1
VCWAGAGLSLLLVVNVLPRFCLFLLFALYLSLFYAGPIFMSYQWDLFLLEMGFAALILSFATAPGIFLLRWLMFRFMFMSGVVKLLSADPPAVSRRANGGIGGCWENRPMVHLKVPVNRAN